MSTLLVRWVFAALCGVFFIAIGGVAGWEWVRFGRGQSALSPRHFRWRLLSALAWLVVLGAFFVATVWLWPPSQTGARVPLSPAETILARRFVLVTAYALLLMMVAFVLMAVDMFWTIQIGRREAALRARQSQDALRRELQRVERGESGGQNGSR